MLFFRCRRDNVNECAFFSTHGTRFLHNDNLSKSIILICTRRDNGHTLRFKGVYFRLEAFNASNNVGITRQVAFNDCRFCYFFRRGLTICILRLANDVKGVVTSITRVHHARRYIASDVGRRVHVQVPRRSLFVSRTGTT